MGSFSSRPKTLCPSLEKSRASSGVKPCISAMSAPATKDFSPAPLKIRALLAARSSFKIDSSRVPSVSSLPRTLEFKALSLSGRLTVQISTVPLEISWVSTFKISSNSIGLFPQRIAISKNVKESVFSASNRNDKSHVLFFFQASPHLRTDEAKEPLDTWSHQVLYKELP